MIGALQRWLLKGSPGLMPFLAMAGLMAIPEHAFVKRDASLEPIKKREFLQVYSRNTPTSFYEGRQGSTGFEYELFRRLGDRLGVRLAVDREHNIAGVLSAVRHHDADLGAAGLPLAPGTPGVHYSKPLMNAQPLVIYHRGDRRPTTLEDLADLDVVVLANSGPGKALRKAQDQLPTLSWKETSTLEVTDLMQLINDGRLDAAVIFDHQFRLNRLFYPQVENGFPLGPPQSLVWAFPAKGSLGLVEAANRFIDQQRSSGRLLALIHQYFGEDNYLEYVGARRFNHQIKTTLPRYEALFKEASDDTGLDWKLLAALGYQESHWNPNAVSPTGVRGLMMLTRPTARRMGIANRRDAAQSIDGGARYLKSIKARLPDGLEEPDRTWAALASYNIGLGHILDARKLVRLQGKNPDTWENIKAALPLLQKRHWYQQVAHGYAPGHIAVYYVRNIQRYYAMLDYVTRNQRRFSPPNRIKDDDQLPDFNTVPPVD
ncbi:membrane-bound lytic murein transglycosylase MltF [Larsenimonas salina]|uniref:membrane-bound lytic murein transglycosylase MltF n=1 Tax=Larsenimonas salina TaxID=1295565 RepID=UPI0020737FDE|nr:membrane-bound lytic murein transglycosylase MltF [Larsenimonas salina]MCM5703987.1 membrane-bound lytic murein transglycosylase MltF [Larsenimonas salina]